MIYHRLLTAIVVVYCVGNITAVFVGTNHAVIFIIELFWLWLPPFLLMSSVLLYHFSRGDRDASEITNNNSDRRSHLDPISLLTLFVHLIVILIVAFVNCFFMTLANYAT